MQPICAPIRSDVCAVAPDRANLLPTDGLPDTLPIRDRAAGEKKLPIRGVDIRNGRGVTDAYSGDVGR
jgi:hypothetical protein